MRAEADDEGLCGVDVVKIVRYVFGVVGAGLLVGALFAVQNTRSFVGEAVSAQGTVVDLVQSRSSSDSGDRYTYAPVVRFDTAQGETVTFTSSVASSPPSYRVGETVDLLYSPTEPKRARIRDWFSLWGVATILGSLGTVFSAVSIGLTVIGIRSRRARRPRVELASQGALVEADFQGVEPSDGLSGEGYRIVAQWLNPDTHELYLFRSEDIPFDPTRHITSDKIKVYIAPNDPTQHYMDISFLPRMAR